MSLSIFDWFEKATHVKKKKKIDRIAEIRQVTPDIAFMITPRVLYTSSSEQVCLRTILFIHHERIYCILFEYKDIFKSLQFKTQSYNTSELNTSQFYRKIHNSRLYTSFIKPHVKKLTIPYCLEKKLNGS